MNTKTNIVAAVAILTTLAIPGIASAQADYLPPPSHAWSQMETTNVLVDGGASVVAPKRHRGQYIENPYRQFSPAGPAMFPAFPANGGGG